MTDPHTDSGLISGEGLERPLRSALAFAASRSAITSAEEQAILAAFQARPTIAAIPDGLAEVRKVETVTGDFYTEPGEPFWRIEIDGFCADFEHEAAANNFAAAINRRTLQAADRTAQPVDDDDLTTVYLLGKHDGRKEAAQGREMVLEEAARVSEGYYPARSHLSTIGHRIANAIRALKDQSNDRT